MLRWYGSYILKARQIYFRNRQPTASYHTIFINYDTMFLTPAIFRATIKVEHAISQTVGARKMRAVYSYSPSNSKRKDVEHVPLSGSGQKIHALKKCYIFFSIPRKTIVLRWYGSYILKARPIYFRNRQPTAPYQTIFINYDTMFLITATFRATIKVVRAFSQTVGAKKMRAV